MNSLSPAMLALIVVLIFASIVVVSVLIVKSIIKKKGQKRTEDLQRQLEMEAQKRFFTFLKEGEQERDFITIPANDIIEAEKELEELFPNRKLTLVEQC